MKCKVQSVSQLKKLASQKLEAEFAQRYQEATLEGALQGMAFVMYALELRQGWKGKRQQQLFEDMMSLTEFTQIAPWLQPYNAQDIKKHVEEEFGIDFNRLLECICATPPEV